MNPVLILTHNNLDLTKRCVESIHAQDVETSLLVFDNGSTDGTVDWLRTSESNAGWMNTRENVGVSKGWNEGLGAFFGWPHWDYVLVVGSDTIIPPNFYADLLSFDLPFVTGCGFGTMDQAMQPAWLTPLDPHPEFNAFLITRNVWETVGPFDEQMVSWASDCDYHVRAHRLGINFWKAGVPFFHYGSATIKNSSPDEQQKYHERANLDREVFRSKYGCVPGTSEYDKLFA